VAIWYNPFSENGERTQRESLPEQIFSSQNIPPVPLTPNSATTSGFPTSPYNKEIFEPVWKRFDQPVAQKKSNRDWTLGADAGPSLLEQYVGSPGNFRLVQYYTKARLQAPEAGSNTITFGRLAQELISGKIPIGDKETLYYAPANLTIIGDAYANPALTYASLTQVSRPDKKVPAAKDTLVTATLDKDGNEGSGADSGFGKHGISNVHYVQTTGRNIPSVFWEFLNRSDIINDNGNYINARLYDWVVQFGYPISEAYWATATVNGKLHTILLQAYERQVLVYFPDDKRVVTTDVGKHYFQWRYPTEQFVPTVAPDGKPNVSAARLIIGNAKIARVISLGAGRLSRSTLFNRTTGKIYSDVNDPGLVAGFRLVVTTPEGQRGSIVGSQFSYTGYKLLDWSESSQTIELVGESSINGNPVQLRLYYRVHFGQDFIEKWVSLDPVPALKNWHVRYAYTEITPLNANFQPYKVPMPDDERLPLRDYSELTNDIPNGAFFENVLELEKGVEGLYYFSASPLGGEYYKDKKVEMIHEEYHDLATKFTSGKGILGVYSGNGEIGTKRYTEYLGNHYALMAKRNQPIWYSTWYPFMHAIDEKVLLDQLNLIGPLRVFDVFHVDAGWESNSPLEIDPKKFPQGLKPVADKANEYGMRLGIWINPFSYSYAGFVDYSEFHRKNPQWHVPGRSAFNLERGYNIGPFGINTPYYDYVKDRLTKVVRENNVQVIYWDGADWNIPDAGAPGLTKEQSRLERIKGTKRLVALADELRKINPDLIIVSWNSTADVHLLSAVEQLQLSDIWELKLGESEIARVKQFYFSTKFLPYYAIWGDWYSLTYKENKDNNLAQPMPTLTYALNTMIGTGATIAGGSLDFNLVNRIKPELAAHIKKIFTWRKRFEYYFKVYQPIFDYPQNERVFGEAHVLGGAGFLIINNPTNQAKQISLPLSNPTLELDQNKSYTLYDWSDFESAKKIGQIKPGEGYVVTVDPKSVKIIGIDVPDSVGLNTQK
jgi:hypothetical protein